MFVRIRGKGACPENSQAATMHIRGFRHTNSAAPPDCFYPLLTTSSSSAPSSSSQVAVEMRPFRFAVFPFGIRAAALTEAQAKFIAAADAATEQAPVSTLAALDGDVARMVWKETWNLYDILYDEVPLLPWSEDDAAVAATVEEELRLLAESDSPVELAPLKSLADKTDDFVLASTRVRNQQVVVCPHYYAAAALPEDTFTKIQREPHAVTVAPSGPVVVLDLRDVPVAQAGGKSMVHVAWYVAFAAMQPDSALLRCRAVVVRLPYTAVPTYAQARESAAAATKSSGAATMADAFVEAVDFIGEHITTVRHAMLRELSNTADGVAQVYAQAPPVLVVGSASGALSATVQALTASSSASGVPAEVVVFYGDHLVAASGSSGGDGRAAEYQAMAEACGSAVAVDAVVVPLKALLEGGDEAWDEYTLRERTRLNFCPCCGDCSNEGGADGDEHGHGHGHGHGSDGHEDQHHHHH